MGGGAPVEAQEEAGGHGDAAPGDPGHDGQGLGEADIEGVLEGDLVQVADVPGEFLRQDQEEPHAAHEQGDAGRLPEDGFRFVFQQDPGYAPRG